MLERIFVLIIFFILVIIFHKRFRSGRSKKSIRLPGNISVKNSSLPTVLYFWTDSCVQCRTSQKPVLKNLEKEIGGFNLVDVNAIEENNLTSLFNIKTVPSTVIFSNDGKSRFINNGFADKEELLKQLEEAKN
ncbi:MAG: thioredoxin family protein [Bacteroidetes bacterium]|nr:thioredoxin family protein [Bacteroidota bacterium]